MVLSGRLTPGQRVVEKQVAEQLGVSRIPVRESLAKLVGQGLLIRGRHGEGIRVRDYSLDEVRQLFEFREALDGAAARGAARHATPADLTRLRMICEEAEKEIGNAETERWEQLEHRFHETVGEASHNERVARSVSLLVTECHYLFYVLLRPEGPALPEHQRAVLEQEHWAIVKCIESRDADGAEHVARESMVRAGERAVEFMAARGMLSVAGIQHLIDLAK